jgi:hypothetical protein
MSTARSLPAAEASDSDDVRWALETATALWAKGDAQEALRWLRRAAENASEAGADLRAVMLAKAAAELRSELPATASVPPPPPAPEPAPPPPPAPRAGNGSSRPPALAAAAAQPPADGDAEPGVPTTSRRYLQTEPGLSPGPVHAPRLELMQEPAPELVSTTPGLAAPAPQASLQLVPETTPTGTEGPLAHQAIRVAVRSTGDGNYFAMPLAPGEHAPPGMREVLFVALDPTTRLV